MLQRDRIIAGDLAKLRGQIRNQLGIALGLVRRHEGMDVGEFRPGDRNHFSGRVELHRAGAKRNHAAVEGEVAIGKPPHVAQHFRFRAIEMEDKVSQEAAATGKLRGDRVVRLQTQLFERRSGDLSFGLRSECLPYCLDHGRRGDFIATDADAGLRAGTRPLAADGARWIAEGTTSLAELLRVAGDAG